LFVRIDLCIGIQYKGGLYLLEILHATLRNSNRLSVYLRNYGNTPGSGQNVKIVIIYYNSQCRNFILVKSGYANRKVPLLVPRIRKFLIENDFSNKRLGFNKEQDNDSNLLLSDLS
jgi:hypothetical protein